jgi:hypothetical protein
MEWIKLRIRTHPLDLKQVLTLAVQVFKSNNDLCQIKPNAATSTENKFTLRIYEGFQM